MPFPLTINRVMGLCAFEATSRQIKEFVAPNPTEVFEKFQAQLTSMSIDPLNEIYCELYYKAKSLNITFEADSAVDERNIAVIQKPKKSGEQKKVRFFPDAYYIRNAAVPDNQPIIGLFRSRRIRATIGKTRWDVRIRPSVTACALESLHRRSKLWWTFEGVPLDREKEPTEAESVEFIQKSTKLAEIALDKLRASYVAALKDIETKGRGTLVNADAQLRISLADSTDPAFLNLVDTLTLTSTTFAEAINSKPNAGKTNANDKVARDIRDGAGQVMRFVKKTGGADNAQRMQVTMCSGGRTAVRSEAQPDDWAPSTIRRWAISGLTSSIGMISAEGAAAPSWVQFADNPDLARSVSAARPLSALIGDASARQMEILRVPEPA